MKHINVEITNGICHQAKLETIICKYNGNSKVCFGCCIYSGNTDLPNQFRIKLID